MSERNAVDSGRKVAVFGGGIAGMTVAHECVEAGLSVELFERDPHLGGKAYGSRDAAGRPTEHSIRSFGGHYWFLYDTMKRIPDGARGANRRVFDNLVPLPELRIASLRRSWGIPAFADVSRQRKLRAMVGAMREFGVPYADIAWFLYRVLSFFGTSEARRREMARRSCFDELGLASRSPALASFVRALAEIATAAKPTASAVVVLGLFGRFLLSNSFNRHGMRSSLNVLDGPIDERFIEPWAAELRRRGVRIETGAALDRIEKEGGRVTTAVLADGRRVTADAYVLALNHRGLLEVAPELSTQVVFPREWSGGTQFFLSRIPDRLRVHHTFTMMFDSPWGLIYLLEAPPVWRDTPLPSGVAGVLSVSYTNANSPGIVHGRPFTRCTPAEIEDELLAQIGFTERDCVVGVAFDPLLKRVPEEEFRAASGGFAGWDAAPEPAPDGHRWLSRGTLYIASPESMGAEPDVRTATKNLFLAGEFIKTDNLTPNMERANESGRLCAKAICDALAVPCSILTEPVPEPFAPMRRIDSVLYGALTSEGRMQRRADGAARA